MLYVLKTCEHEHNSWEWEKNINKKREHRNQMVPNKTEKNDVPNGGYTLNLVYMILHNKMIMLIYPWPLFFFKGFNLIQDDIGQVKQLI